MIAPYPKTEISRILIVDDCRDNAESMTRLLRLVGHDVRVAFDGLEALEVARIQRPNFVLLDIGLPGIDGFQVASRIRREISDSVVLIAITGYGEEGARRRALQADFDHFLSKPTNPESLLELLRGSSPSCLPSDPDVAAKGEESVLVYHRQAELINALGLHLRAADKFVRVTGQFRAKVRVSFGDRTVNGTSILDLTTLAAECGSRLHLEADGPDAESALDALVALIGRGFDEQPGSEDRSSLLDQLNRSHN